MSERLAYAKINLALVVGPPRADGNHEVTTVLQRVGLADRLHIESAPGLSVEGFSGDTLIRRALVRVAEEVGVEPAWRVLVDKQIPVSAGLGGGSSDAAAALLLANATLERPLEPKRLSELGAGLGADVPFFLAEGPQLGEGDGTILTRLELPQRFTVLLLLPDGETKASTGDVYAAFDTRNGSAGYEERRAAVLSALATGDLGALPPNDLASSPLAAELCRLGAFRADVSGAGPTVYGLFADEATATAAAARVERLGRVWVVPRAW
ncbi:MAG: 4-(cytidine 5'-diphospho)-2-C-methyl-D-erythritol kinase [Verrucomicrobiota bacterium]